MLVPCRNARRDQRLRPTSSSIPATAWRIPRADGGGVLIGRWLSCSMPVCVICTDVGVKSLHHSKIHPRQMLWTARVRMHAHMYFRNTPVKLTDSRRHGAGNGAYYSSSKAIRPASTVAAATGSSSGLPMQRQTVKRDQSSRKWLHTLCSSSLGGSLGIDHSRPTADLFVWDDLRF